MDNIVFYFSGTGNCLKVAKSILKELGTGEIVSMGKPGSFCLEKQYDTIGFVYPTYFWGLPKKVIEFAENLKTGSNASAYFYSVATHGGSAGNSIYQLHELFLNKHGIKINFGQKLRMFSNYVVMYDMVNKVKEITAKSDEDLVPIINSIKKRETNNVNKLTKVLAFLNKWFIKKVWTMDSDYSVNSNCTGCGICRDICPVKNIDIKNDRPLFNHKCEQCVACIQFCPQTAINYKNQTQKRRRYTNPGIDYRELSERNNA